MKIKIFLLMFSLNFLIYKNCFAFHMNDFLANYLKNEFGFEEVYIDSLKINSNMDNEIPDNVRVEKIYGRLLKFEAIKNERVYEGKAEIRAYKKVLVSKNPLEKGKEISEDDVMEKLIEYSKVPKGAVTERSSIVGKSLKSSIQANTIFTDAKLISIKKGENVVLKIDRPNFSVKMVGKALEDGNIGKLIRVLNLSSNKVIKGVVHDDKTVIVNF